MSAELRALVAQFSVGDVVFDEEVPAVLGIVIEKRFIALTVVWEHGGRSGGPGLVPSLRHCEPRVTVTAPSGAAAVRAWNREQAVSAALRKAGLRGREDAGRMARIADAWRRWGMEHGYVW